MEEKHKSPWVDFDQILVPAVDMYGTKWSKIVKLMPRSISANAVRSRWARVQKTVQKNRKYTRNFRCRICKQPKRGHCWVDCQRIASQTNIVSKEVDCLNGGEKEYIDDANDGAKDCATGDEDVNYAKDVICAIGCDMNDASVTFDASVKYTDSANGSGEDGAQNGEDFMQEMQELIDDGIHILHDESILEKLSQVVQNNRDRTAQIEHNIESIESRIETYLITYCI